MKLLPLLAMFPLVVTAPVLADTYGQLCTMGTTLAQLVEQRCNVFETEDRIVIDGNKQTRPNTYQRISDVSPIFLHEQSGRRVVKSVERGMTHLTTVDGPVVYVTSFSN